MSRVRNPGFLGQSCNIYDFTNICKAGAPLLHPNIKLPVNRIRNRYYTSVLEAAGQHDSGFDLQFKTRLSTASRACGPHSGLLQLFAAE